MGRKKVVEESPTQQLEKLLQNEKDEKEKIIQVALEKYEQAMDELTDARYNFLIACGILDNNLPLDDNQSWYDIIVNSKKDTYS